MKSKGHRLALKITACRLAALGLAVAVFYGVSWLPYRVALRDGVGWVMRRAGLATSTAVFEGSPALIAGGKQFYFTPDCTYVDLWLILIPFLWRLDWSWRRNAGCILGFGLLVGAVNFLRVCVSTYFYARGHSWFMAHDLEDYILYYPTLAGLVLAALRRDWGRREAVPEAAVVTEATPGKPC